MRILLWLMILGLWLPSLAQATTYYVATTGSNSNEGISESTPKLTVAHCVSIMVAGDTCYVRGGTYNEGVIRFSKTGTQAAPIKLLNYPNESPVIDFIQPESPTFDRILIQHSSGSNVAIGWITIEGFELTGGHDGIKWHNLHDSVIRKNHIHDNGYMGMLGVGGTRILIERNIIHHNGRFAACDAGTTTLCTQDHGIYAHGTYYTITNNVFYYHQGFGVQQNGSSSSDYSASLNPSVEFAGAQNWVVSDNTFAYSRTRGGMVVWGGNCDDARIENNIFYENNIERPANPQGIEFSGASGATGVLIRNNHFFGSGSGGTAAIGGIQPGDLVTSGNVINVSAPAFVNGGSNSLPASPDFRLTASSPVNIARTNEFTNNSTLVVGAFKTLASPVASMATNKMTVTFPLSTAGPVIIPSTTGLSVTCTANPTACPGSPTITAASRKSGTDAQVEIEIGGIAGNACAAGQDWKISYNSSTGSWTDSAHIGPVPGTHQKIFSITNLLAANDCTGSGPPAEPGTPHIHYKMDEGTGTNLNDETANNLDGTLTGGGTWGTGKTGFGVVLTAQSGQYVAIPWGSGVNPSTQSFTVAFGVFLDASQVSLSRAYLGSALGSNQRFYVSTLGGTWRIGIQASNDATASELAVVAGWNYIVVQMDSATDTATLCVNRVCSVTAGGQKTYTSYTLASNLELGRLGGQASGGGGTFDDPLVYLNATVSPDDLYDTFNESGPAPVAGTFDQSTVQAQGVYLVNGVPSNLVAVGLPKKVIVGGAVAWVFQIHCTNVEDCNRTAFRLAYRKNGAGSWRHVPDIETADGIYMWGPSSAALLNSGETTTRLTGSCAVTNGVTLLTSGQVPSVDLPQDGCVMLRWIVRVGNVPGVFFDLRVEMEGGTAFTGTYNLARIDVIDPSANVGP